MSTCPILPLELHQCIIDLIDDVATLKNVALTSKTFYSLVCKRIWSVTRLRRLDGLLAIKHLPVKELDLSDLECSDSHLAVVATMNGLASLNISTSVKTLVSSWTTQGLEHLKALSALEVLDMSGCVRLTPGCLKHIQHIPLKELRVDNCRFNDEHIKVIAEIKSLVVVSLINDYLTDIGMGYLSSLDQLQNLDISACRQITPVGLRSIANLPIQTLSMQSCCSDGHLEVISMFSTLKELSICHSRHISDAGLTYICALKQLDYLNINFCTSLTLAGLDAISNSPIQKLSMRCVIYSIRDIVGLDDVLQKFSNLKKLDVHDIRTIPFEKLGLEPI